MSRNTLIGALVALVIIIAGVWYFTQPSQTKPLPAEAHEAAVRSVVTDFGGQLQKVSLLASSTQAAAEIQAYYSPYLSSGLLAQWEENPSIALGRQTSSPWPDRIEISSVAPVDADTYDVQGNVIEVANTASSTEGVVGVYPIHFRVDNIGGRWLISSAEESSTSVQ